MDRAIYREVESVKHMVPGVLFNRICAKKSTCRYMTLGWFCWHFVNDLLLYEPIGDTKLEGILSSLIDADNLRIWDKIYFRAR